MRLGLGIVLSLPQQHTEPPHSVGLLRANAERPYERDAKASDEVTSLHVLPPQASDHNLPHREKRPPAKCLPMSLMGRVSRVPSGYDGA
jgi:hypothetical protein